MAESSSGNQDTQAGNNSVPKSSSSNSLRLTPSQALRRGNSSAGGSGNGSGGGNGNGSRSRSENTGGSTPKTRADSASNNGNKNNNNNNRRRRNNRNSNSNNKNKNENNQNGPSPPFGERGETNEKQQQQQQQQRQRQRQRGNNKKGGKPNVAGGDIDANATPSQNNHNATDTTDLGNHNNNNNNNNPGENKGKKQRQRQRPKAKGKKGGGGNSNSNSNSNTEASASGDERGNAQSPAKPKKFRNRNNKKKKKNNNNKYPWRRHIPEGTVDPITLEELDTLEYPPFALVADEPYIPVPEWPIPPGSDRAVRSDASPPQQNRTQQPNSGDDDNDDNYNDDDDDNDDDDAEDQNRQRLADQWGEFMLPAKETSTGATTTTTKQQQQQQSKGPALSERPLNLFDGRALAFYMVSQLQFIDPFTRRDLTRPELVNLDRYLDRYGSGNPNNRRNTNTNNTNNNNKQARAKKLRVTDAYDAKGITLSSAGAAAATARGRADILQQTAQQLLDSLFAGPQQRQQESTTSLQEQYASLQRQERAVVARHERRFEGEPFGGGFGFGADASGGSDGGGGGGGGFVIIDDDENPELRGRGHDDFPSLGALPGAGGHAATFSSSSSSSLYSASHIAGQHGRGGTNLSAQGPGAFPSLPTPASALASASASAAPGTAAAAARTTQSHDSSSKKPPAKPSKTLSKISGIVKKTTSEERQRQWEARETARRKAMMSNLTLGMNHSLAGVDPSLPTVPTSSASVVAPVTDEQIQRNRAFAEALGVKPATQRHYASGWARPTTTSATTAATTAVTAFSTRSGDEHADELEAALYPDELILQARDTRMQFLLKLEKRWKTFLNDDAAASLPLNRMDRASRKFVHQYAEFWKLKTESFDPEPNRYIHCVKLLETRMPVPLLSEVARNWRGPAALPLPDATRTIASFLNSNNNINNSNSNNDHTSQQTAGQSSGSGLREVAKPMLRSATALSSSKGDLVAFGRAAFQNSRSDALRDKERPKMTLLPRSVPLELPPFEEQRKEQQEATLKIDEDLRKRRVLMEEKRQRERELEQKKRRALEDAFASDEDEDEAGRKTAGGSDDDSDWGDDQEALYNGSDEEE